MSPHLPGNLFYFLQSPQGAVMEHPAWPAAGKWTPTEREPFSSRIPGASTHRSPAGLQRVFLGHQPTSSQGRCDLCYETCQTFLQPAKRGFIHDDSSRVSSDSRRFHSWLLLGVHVGQSAPSSCAFRDEPGLTADSPHIHQDSLVPSTREMSASRGHSGMFAHWQISLVS